MRYILEILVFLPYLVTGAIQNYPGTFEYIVVGAGSAGATVASRLSENNFASVLLIEAGPEPPSLSDLPPFSLVFDTGTAINWNYTTEPNGKSCLGGVNKSCPYYLGRTLGGTSQINGMLYVRGSKADYDLWKNKDGAVGWGYDDVLPFFKKAEGTRISDDIIEPKFHGTNGPLTTEVNSYYTDLRAAYLKGLKEIGSPILDYNGKQQEGFGISQVNTRNGYRCSTNKAYLEPVRSRKNLQILVNSLVTKIEIDSSNVAKGVYFTQGKNNFFVKAKKEVIVSCGGINSPKLLMMSGIGPRKHLEDLGIKVVADLPVGQNLQDHIIAPLYYTVSRSNVSTLAEILEVINQTKNSSFQFPKPLKRILRSPFGAEVFGYLNSGLEKGPKDYNDLQFFLVSGIGSQKYFTPKLTKFFEQYKKRKGFVVLPAILHPKSKGNITLISTDPNVPPLINMNYLSDPRDMKVLIYGLKKGRDLAATKVMSGFEPTEISPVPGCKKIDVKSDKYLECVARTLTTSLYHACSTCKMGDPADKSTVVDPNLRVKGVKNLRVVDASIMPRIVSANTNAPTIMIGEKAADQIKKGLK